jgi:beta-lactamase superfamily II metal-dependent hydrolase
VFRIEVLPAAHGDAIWIEYGDPKRPTRVVVDGGPAPTYEAGLLQRLLRMPPDDRRIDLFVVTHIDADHIDGAIIFLQQAKRLGVRLGEIWFNAWRQISAGEADTLQPLQGEFLAALIDEGRFQTIWNTRVNGRKIEVPDEGPLPAWGLPGEARLTLLSPGSRQIKRLRSRWASAIRDFSPGDTAEALARLEARREYRPPALPAAFAGGSGGEDRSVANGSSIAFVLEYGGASCLLAGDAHARVLAASLRRLAQERNPGRGGVVQLDAVKLPHHGSIANVSEELLAVVECPRWIVSTNGDIFSHPDRATAELVADRSGRPPEFLCNYRSASTERFADRGGTSRWHTRYPGEGAVAGVTGGIVVDLSPPRAGGRRGGRAAPARRRRRPTRR